MAKIRTQPWRFDAFPSNVYACYKLCLYYPPGEGNTRIAGLLIDALRKGKGIQVVRAIKKLNDKCKQNG